VAVLAALAVADRADLWRMLGFAVDPPADAAADPGAATVPGVPADLREGTAWVGGVAHLLGRPGRGIVGWFAHGLDVVDGLAQCPSPAVRPDPAATGRDAPDDDRPRTGGQRATGPTTRHPNGVVALDHVVVRSPDLDRTVAALEAAGVELRRRRVADPALGAASGNGADLRRATPAVVQAFFRMGPTILEVVGPAEATGDGPARFWGLAFAVADLDATAAFLGARLRPAVDAVQPGRRIATLDRGAGSSVPIAFLSARHP
jgi:hypothetical protein